MKKILSLFLVLSITLTLITGCGSSDNISDVPPLDLKQSDSLSQEKPELNSEKPTDDQAEKKDAIYKYLQENSEYRLNQTAVENLISASDNNQTYKAQISEFIDALYRAAVKCEFSNFEMETDESYTVNVKITTVDFTNFNIEDAINSASEIINVNAVSTKAEVEISDDMSVDEIYDILFLETLEEMTKSASDLLSLSGIKQNEPVEKNFRLTKAGEDWVVQEF